MRERFFTLLCFLGAFMVANAFAGTKSPAPPQIAQPVQVGQVSPSDQQQALNNTAELLKQVAALSKKVDALSTQLTALTATTNGLQKTFATICYNATQVRLPSSYVGWVIQCD